MNDIEQILTELLNLFESRFRVIGASYNPRTRQYTISYSNAPEDHTMRFLHIPDTDIPDLLGGNAYSAIKNHTQPNWQKLSLEWES
jgi:hypothetical protein